VTAEAEIAALIDADPGSMFADPNEAPAKGEEMSSWAPVDLDPVLSGEFKVEPPSLMLRTDGEGLIYRGRLHALSSEPEGGKGWLTLHTAAEALAAEERVLMLDFHRCFQAVVVLIVESRRVARHGPHDSPTRSAWRIYWRTPHPQVPGLALGLLNGRKPPG
jgi:hypothetical protein